jgi:two-component system, chemotaxis family, sensor kinase CheA
MSGEFSTDSLEEMFLFETTQNLEQLEQLILSNEKSSVYSHESINEIFRIMHTIKGSSSMMMFDSISGISHLVEDLFSFIRENQSLEIDYTTLSDLILESLDFMKVELVKVKSGDSVDGESENLNQDIKLFLEKLKKLSAKASDIDVLVPEKDTKSDEGTSENEETTYKNLYKAIIFFEEDCGMENIRAFGLIHSLTEFAEIVRQSPEDIIDNDESTLIIRNNGFEFIFKTDKTYTMMRDFLQQTIFLKKLELTQLEDVEENEVIGGANEKDRYLSDEKKEIQMGQEDNQMADKEVHSSLHQNIISVNVAKLDMMMDLIGEMVIAESMVSQNPDLNGLKLDNFQKSAMQLHKIVNDLQYLVMSIRMVPLNTTFQKMNRIIRDMCKKLNKDVNLVISGEDTEVDKNIIEHISDPLMHLIRNSVDHGIETAEQRKALGKPKIGTVSIEAMNDGSYVYIIVRDDGKGLNKQSILEHARREGILLKSPDQMSDREIYSIIFLPGFSTNENVTEYSGRGVGLDVVVKEIESIGGKVSVESLVNKGTSITLQIPLTLAIIDGMNIKVGNSYYTIPIASIKESFRPKTSDIFRDPDSKEMVMIRGQIFRIIRLHELFKSSTYRANLEEGILLVVEYGDRTLCLFADEMIGTQQVVLKKLPDYVKKENGISGCTLLGDGNISLILDVGRILNF